MVQEAVERKPKIKCQFIVPKKNRPCRMFALDDEKFCGEHIVLDTERQGTVPEDRVRIKCPLDSTHTCFLKKLEKHLKVCNARERDRPAYYVKDVNAGDSLRQPEGQTIHQLSDSALLELLDKISTLHDEHVSPPEVADESAHEALTESLQNPSYGADTLKHLRQNSALLAVLRDAGQLGGERTYVELGSGKAQLSFWLARAVSSRSRIVLVDFASHRHKAENKLKELEDMPAVQRLKIDIRHLSLAGCESCRGRAVVAISKHLCGAATDLGIRAATAAMTDCNGSPATAAASSSPPDGAQPREDLPRGGQPTVNPPSGDGPAGAADVRGIMIAVCCHHRVDWPSYVGKQFLQDVCQFSAADFTALKGVAAWATCGAPSWDSERPRRERRRRPDGNTPLIESNQSTTAVEQSAAVGEESTDASISNTDSDRPAVATAKLAATVEGASATSETADEVSPAAAASRAVELQKRRGASEERDDNKRQRLDGPGAADGRPGSGSREASAGRYQRLGLTPERRTTVGFRCKRLLDEGRRRYLQHRGFTARLVRFVPENVSPENVLLLATR